MAGGVIKRKTRRGSGVSFSDINVTPLVDVMLVLLVVFMVTAPLLNVGVPVNLPKTTAATVDDKTQPVVLTVNANGETFVQEQPVKRYELVQQLAALTKNDLEAKIYVRGDRDLAYGQVMEVMGLIAAAGYTKVSLLAEAADPLPAASRGK